MVQLRLIYHQLFILGVHGDIVLGIQTLIYDLVIPVSYPKQHSMIGPTLAPLQWSGMLCSKSNAPSLLMFLK